MGTSFPQPSIERGETAEKRVVIRGIQRGQIFWVDIPAEHVVGSEQFHEDGPTPFVIVSRQLINSSLHAVQGVPLSRLKDKAVTGVFRTFRVRVPASEVTFFDVGTDEKPLEQVDMLALTEQTRVLGHGRLLWGPAGKVTVEALHSIEAGIRYVFDIPDSTPPR